MAAKASQIEVGGRTLRVTNLDKVMYPATGTTKGDVIAYYQAVAPWMVPHVAGRPATRKRWVHGVEGPAFFTKNADSGTLEWIRTVGIEHSRETLRYPIIDDAATLVFMAQLAALEIHVPQWRFGREASGVGLADVGDGADLLTAQHPDRLVLDLDPGEGAGLEECVTLALIVKEILDGVGLVSVPVTSGSKGIHLYAGLDGHLTSGEASEFARQLAVALEGSHPDLVVSDMKKELRGGKVLLDWSQNNGSKTTVSPYSLRGRTLPHVAAPRTWDEIGPGLKQLSYLEVLDRLHTIGDPLAVLLPGHGDLINRSIPEPVEGLGPKASTSSASGSSGTPAGAIPEPAVRSASDRLSTYRSMRDAAKTPEPVPTAAPTPRDAQTFVIQDHHARRHHHDVRLERDGVLVSWAVPKLTPLVPKVNHLAVQTEDHPLEYATFSGTIPKGEYGGGEMSIWDSGTYELEKWRDGREVIVTLHGRHDGGLGGVPRTYVLIHTAHGDEKNWLIHLRADADPAIPGANPVQRGSRSSNSPHIDPTSASTTTPYPSPAPSTDPLPTFDPMLATAASESEVRGEDWHFEVKWDGYRGIATVAGGVHTIKTRKGQDYTATYPELAELVEVVGDHAAVIDGEIVALGPDGRSHFELLQNHGRTDAAAHYMAFDLLWLDGESLIDSPYTERRAALEALLGNGGRFVHVPSTFGTDRELAFTASKEGGLEGLIAKRASSTYAPGRRSRSWLKLKNVRHQEAIVVGWSPGERGRAGTVGSLLLAVNEGGRLAYIGRAGSGFTDRGLAEALAKLRPLHRDTPPLDGVPRLDARDAHWVEPTLVGEVSFTEFTSAGTLRHPVWRGWRPDKDPADVVREVQ
ncbi:MAG TPA: ATP-dependent DNA ligase [Propioniciclava tarda]|nr:ATP-dependent DNA ligase [Propioniciclava tarda]